MALLQIAEPGQSTAPHQHRLAAGIDLGTTNSLVATVRSGATETLPDAQGRQLLPSVVRYLDDGGRVVGQEAKAAAVTDPLNTIASVKRLMGRGIKDVKTLGSRLPYAFADADAVVPRLRTACGDVSAVEVSAEILKALRVRDAQSLERAADYAVAGLLLDAWVPGTYGGTGHTFNWQLAARVARQRPVILAGRLTPENVAEAARAVRPYAVDVSSGVEAAPGVKDPVKVAAFIRAAKGTGSGATDAGGKGTP